MAKESTLTTRRAELAKMLRELDATIHEIAINGTATASISAGGGSKSYTRIDLANLRALRTEYANRLAQLNRAVTVGSSPAGIRRVMTVRL